MKTKDNVNKLNQNGITLIALIITIIVLLILAGITINIIINGKLLGQAQNATDRYEQAQRQEINDLDNVVEKINNKGSSNNTDADNTTTDPSTPPEIPEKTLSSMAQPGDYVRYEVPKKTFTMSTEQTGYTSSQSYNTEYYTGLWQVLYNDTKYGLQIISANDVTNGKRLYLEGKVGYNNSVATLNNFCSNYVNSKYGISGRCIGSNPLSPEGTTDMYIGNYDYLKQYAQDLIRNDTEYQTDINALKMAKHQNPNGIWNISKSYWLAFRNIDSYSSHTIFYVGCLYTDINLSDYGSLWTVADTGSTTSNNVYNGVRAVITLKSGIKTSNGVGSFDNPYELVE